MKVRFNKSNLPFLREVFGKKNKPRDYWTLARRMNKNEAYTSQTEREEFLLQKGAYSGDVYSMCELARYIFNANDRRLPQALSWWHKAALKYDKGATADIRFFPIAERIKSYSSGSSRYADIEVKCTLLAEFILTDLGASQWLTQNEDERIARCEKLVSEASEVLGIKAPGLIFERGLKMNENRLVDGLAYPSEWILKVRHEVLNDYERLLQVIFHEIGHFVVFSMWDKSFSEDYLKLRRIYGITEERKKEWVADKKNPNNENTPAGEEDPDTLSYGVWLTWCLYFKH